MRFRASDVAAATGGRLIGPDVQLEGATFDTRTAQPGELFVALVADRDGHRFLPAAQAAGAPAALVATGRSVAAPEGLTVIEVPDTGAALGRLAAWGREQLHGSAERALTAVGITGSVGKTSTKDLTAAALAPSRRVVASPRSFNNDQGLPVTILGAPADTEVLVLEMGMRGFGEIERLCAIGRPSIGVVTAVGESHTARVGGIDGVARAKSEMVTSLPADGVAVLNADDARVAAMAALAPGRVVTYGATPDAEVRLADLALDELGRPRFQVSTPWGSHEVALAASGAHNALNAAAALAVTGVVGGDLDTAVDALSRAVVSGMRMETARASSGAVVVNDAYNANPTSMRAALATIAALPARRRFAVLGLMAELDDPVAAHRGIAAAAAELGVQVVAVGTDLYGVDPVDDAVAAVAALGPLGDGDVVLVKASRVAALDQVATHLLT